MVGIEPPERYTHHPFDKAILNSIRSLRSDNWHGISYIIKDYLVIGVFAYLTLGVSWWLYPISVLMIGAHQRGLSTILHDSAHGVLARNKTLNFLLGTLPTAWLIFQRHLAYRDSHVMTHHPYLGRADKDPDLGFFIEEGVFEPASDRSFIIRIILLPLIGSKTVAYLKYLMRYRYQMLMDQISGKSTQSEPKRSNWRYGFDKWGFAAFWATVTAIGVLRPEVGMAVVLLWVVPYLTSFHTIGWFIEMSEHCSSVEGRVSNVLMARNRRSRHIEKWLTDINNDSFHLVHHLDPTTPFWLLPVAHGIRMKDPVYAAHCKETGGIFQTGPDGAPSIVTLLRAQNAQRYRGSRDVAVQFTTI